MRAQGVENFAATRPLPDVLDLIRRFHFDIAQATNPVTLNALRQLVPVSQI